VLELDRDALSFYVALGRERRVGAGAGWRRGGRGDQVGKAEEEGGVTGCDGGDARLGGGLD